MFNFLNPTSTFHNNNEIQNQNFTYPMNSTIYPTGNNFNENNFEQLNGSANSYCEENHYILNDESSISNEKNDSLEMVKLDYDLTKEPFQIGPGGDEFSQNNAMTREEIQTISAKYTHQRFPIKLWNLASDENFKPIQWSLDGLSLLIDEASLEPLLGYLFRSKKFSSFLRQLHLYSFRKVTRARTIRSNGSFLQPGEYKTSDDRISEYQCNYFQRDKPDDIKSVRRYYRYSQMQKSDSSQTDNSLTINPIFNFN